MKRLSCFNIMEVDVMIMVTGGSGKLGNELKKLLPDAIFPEKHVLNIEQEHSVKEFFGLFGSDIECVKKYVSN